MRFALKILFGVGISLSVITDVSLYILRTSFPRVGDAPIIKIERTAERIAGMTESDLGAIFDYLQTVSPVKNGVDKFPE